jgi:FMN-dependent NADH-azoreductase
MAKLLYITANPKAEEQSFSLSVGRAFLNAYKQQNPQDEIVELDLYQIDIPYIDTDVFSGWGKLQQGHAFDQLSAEEKAKVSRINQLTDQFIEADKYVFVTPLWNFSFPPKMKAYIDTICIAGKTFKYTENGPVGLLKNKKAVHIQARGGVYSEGPAKEMEFGDRYLKAVLGFIGITDVQSVIAEGMAAFPNEAEGIKEKAIKQAEEVAKNF